MFIKNIIMMPRSEGTTIACLTWSPRWHLQKQVSNSWCKHWTDPEYVRNSSIFLELLPVILSSFFWKASRNCQLRLATFVSGLKKDHDIDCVWDTGSRVTCGRSVLDLKVSC
ncbi:hypothetical protein BWQ96_00428 [Gracilariopsis chorda]|uniref:Uncharacterized protein n=1 Tax=Gracilariopsis chorda TaxID=448386 RepID=A0A2V3J5S3_9FLOR|nr:hypothetical protein BWQ96_00428 [Gracilariopsis chorda]|eukprot:PXF49776.1 hypothetical protein BWQ96_00428 [Gracilariopsis chorda]